jgi:hypothetical protein
VSSRAYARFKLGVTYGCLAAVVFAAGALARHLGRGPLILVAVLVVGASVVVALGAAGRTGRG